MFLQNFMIRRFCAYKAFQKSWIALYLSVDLMTKRAKSTTLYQISQSIRIGADLVLCYGVEYHSVAIDTEQNLHEKEGVDESVIFITN